MKNTVKKILALVFVVAMVCSLAVPAFAAEEFEQFTVEVIVIDPDGDNLTAVEADEETKTEASKGVKVSVDKATKANVLDVLKAADAADTGIKFTIKNSQLTAVAEGDAATRNITTDDVFETSSWVVSVNGKPVNGDLATVSVAKNDKVVVYWADSTIGTKIVAYDDSAIAQGIVSFYYYDAEGNKLPLVGAEVMVGGLVDPLGFESYTVIHSQTVAGSDETVTSTETVIDTVFTTDEKGQIWISPDDLDSNEKTSYTINSIAVKIPEKLRLIDGYTEDEIDYFEDYKDTLLVDILVEGEAVSFDAGLYNVAGATGDMTAVYALVAFAAVATLAAVVVMKKKSVKAN